MKIKTLSPIHIGDGGEYNGMTLLKHKEYLYYIDFKSLMTAFKEFGIDFTKFKSWVINKKKQGKPVLFDFLDLEYKGVINKIIERLISLSQIKIKSLCNADINTDVSTCLKNLHGNPYIPGSEIKGAIVTALLFNFLISNDKFVADLKEVINNNKEALIEASDCISEIRKLQNDKRYQGFQNFKSLKIRYSDKDAFRDILTLRQRPIDQISYDLKRKLKYDQRTIADICYSINSWRKKKQQMINERENLTNKYERLIKKITEDIFKFEEEYKSQYLIYEQGDIEIDLMSFLVLSDSNSAKSTKISESKIVHQNPKTRLNSLYWEIIDTNTLLESQLVIKPEKNIYTRSPFKKKDTESFKFLDGGLSCDEIMRRIYVFSKRILDEEKSYTEYLKRKSNNFIINNALSHINFLISQNKKEEPILRIGKGQGFLSLTMGLLIKDQDKQNNTNIYRNLLGVIQSVKNNINQFPITRRLVKDSQGRFKLPGWIKLSLEPKEELCKN